MESHFETMQQAVEGMSEEEKQEFLRRQVEDRAREIREDEAAREKAGYTQADLITAGCTDGF